MLIPNKHSGYSAGRRLYPGGKGGNVPPPDPRLVESQIRSMGVQDDAIQRILAQSEELSPLIKEQMRFGLDAAKTAYGQSQEDREFFLNRRGALSGLQDRLVSDAQNFNEPERREKLAAQAGADVSQTFGLARGALSRNLSSYGLNPNRGGFGATLANMGTQEALAKAGAFNKTREAARLEGYQLTDRATNALAGYPAMGMSATGAGAGFGGLGLQLANTGLAGVNSGYGTASQLAGGWGQNATSMYGQQATAYGRDQDTQGQFWGALLGTGATLGAAGIGKWSDRRLKQNVEPVGWDDRTGLKLYEFSYVGYPEKRFRGVMADEVESKFPAAVVYDDMGFASVNYDALGIEFLEV